jgi:diadenylate cyclase
VTVVVSEETGSISLSNNGRLVSNLDEAKLRKVLGRLYRTSSRATATRSRWPWQKAVVVNRNG